MKHFSIAFAVFCFWFFLGILFMETTGAIDRKSILTSSVSIESDLDSTSVKIESELIPFVEDNIKKEDLDRFLNEPDTFLGTNLNQNNEQVVQDLTKSIQEKKRELAEDLEKLRNAKKRSDAKNVAPRTFDALFYPEFKHADFVAEQKATSFLSFIKQKLSADPYLHIKIVGHTDYIGDKEDNYLLALDEAKKVREFLIKSLKLPDNQVSAYSDGETEPIYDRDSENRVLNHRIEIYFE